MSEIYICNYGPVSPAGWSAAALSGAIGRQQPLPTGTLARPGWADPLQVRATPPANPRPAFVSHPRLRRTSPIAQYSVAAALEALGGGDASNSPELSQRLGIILCVMSGCVNYSRRFYDEVLTNPLTASPLVFPETVFNAPASHLAAVLGATGRNYTIVGDPGCFLLGLALGAGWLLDGSVDGCLVIGAEEMDWLTSDAARLFDRRMIVSDGAGAIYLRREPGKLGPIVLGGISQAHPFTRRQSRSQAAAKARHEMGGGGQEELLVDGVQGLPRIDRAELAVWRDWPGPRLSPKKVLGEGLTATAAWQCIAAIEAVHNGRHSGATVSVVGSNQQAIAARFQACSEPIQAARSA